MANTPAKTDGQMMNCCTGYPGSDSELYKSAFAYNNSSYTTCYDPGLHGNQTCPVDRNGKSIYGCFPSIGEQIANCRSACVRGHPQDFSRTLYSDEYPMTEYELPIAERGVELYENYGLNTDIRYDSTRYGDNSASRSQMTCTSELGRKVTLFGNVDFGIYCNKASYDGTTGQTTVGTDKIISLGNTDVYYELIVWTDYSSTNEMQRYRYFGNSGVIFNYAGQKLVYIHGKMDNLPEVGYTINEDNTVYYISAYQIARAHFGLTESYIRPESLKMVNGNVNTPINSPGTDSRCNDTWNFKTAGSAAIIFPLPWTHSYFTNDNNSDKSAYNCPGAAHYNSDVMPTNPFNCYGTGIKSFYVPPHMEITSYGVVSVHNRVEYPTSIRSENSKYNNGVFPAYGSSSVSTGSSHNTAVNTNRDTPIDAPVGSIYSVSVRVRQDDDFYNTYVRPANTKFAPEIMLIPGIMLASSFAGSLSAQGIEALAGSPLQMISDPNNFWSSQNPYWTGGSVVINTSYNPGDVLYGPGDLPPGGLAPPQSVSLQENDDGSISCKSGFTASKSGFTSSKTSKTSLANNLSGKTITSKNKSLIKNSADRVAGTGKAVLGNLAGRLRSVVRHTPISLVVDTSAEAPTGGYRVKQFDVINGVFSLEWLYAVYYCAMNGRKVQYNPDTGLYETPGCTPSNPTTISTAAGFSVTGGNSCGKQCMLFRDDYTYQVDNAPISTADIVMQAYCGMRNVSLAYFYWQQGGGLLVNSCSCLTQKSYCPTQFNSNCSTSASNMNTYVTADMAKCSENSSICNYCQITSNQVITALSSCVKNSDNTLVNLGDQCSNNTTNCITVNTDGTTTNNTGTGGNAGNGTKPPTPPDETTQSSFNWKILLILLIVIVAIIAVTYVAIKYRKNKT